MNNSHSIDTQSELFDQVVEFNLYLVRFIDESWLQSLSQYSLMKQLKDNKYSDLHLSSYLLNEFSLDNMFDYDFNNSIKRIALVPAKDIVTLANYIGLVLTTTTFLKLIKKKERFLIVNMLGKNYYQFAVKRANFISQLAVRKAPEFLIDWSNVEKFKQYIFLVGLQTISKSFSQFEKAFVKRFCLKMPKKLQQNMIDMELTPLSISESCQLVMKVFKEVRHSCHLSL